MINKCERWEDLPEDIVHRLFLSDVSISDRKDKNHSKESNYKRKFSILQSKGIGHRAIFDFLGGNENERTNYGNRFMHSNFFQPFGVNNIYF